VHFNLTAPASRFTGGKMACGAGLIDINVGVRQLATIVPDYTIAADQSHFPFDRVLE
jgi:hypothetical protein